jgi:hypothetical protein
VIITAGHEDKAQPTVFHRSLIHTLTCRYAPQHPDFSGYSPSGTPIIGGMPEWRVTMTRAGALPAAARAVLLELARARGQITPNIRHVRTGGA